MKYASYILSWLAVILLLNIFLSYSSTSYKGFLRDTKDKMMWVSKDDVIVKMNKDQIEVNTKILNSIDKLNENIDKLGKTKIQTNSTETENSIWDTLTWETIKKTTPLDIPWTLVTKLLPDINPIKSENTWIFDIKNDKSFDELKYITYNDNKKRIKVYVFENSYDELKVLFKLNSKYKVNESDNFFWYSFYLNPAKKDIKIRFITQLEWKAIWFEILKNSYELLKKSLLN